MAVTRKPARSIARTLATAARKEALDHLRASRSPVKIRVRPDQTAALMAMTMALQSSLRTALEELAVVHDCADGPWLDDLEQIMMRDASNIWAEGLALDAELQALDGGRTLVQALTNALRKQLSTP